jgi:hypothetical protein
MQVLRASLDDLATYATLGHKAQGWLRARGLGQYVPSAHEKHAAAIRDMVESGTLYVVQDAGEDIGFISLDATPSRWWPADGACPLPGWHGGCRINTWAAPLGVCP